jgi:spoIIIJ-associated protein
MGEGEDTLQQGRAWLEQLLHLMAVSVSVQTVAEMLEIESSDLLDSEKKLLLGDSGTTLDALQYLANTLLNLDRPPSLQRAYTIELDGYRRRRHQELQQLTEAAVARVRDGGEEFEMEPLSAAERRQVHVLLQTDEYADIETFSRGKEPHRRLVIRPAQDPQ